ncbi:hypothetical protein NZD89_24395 [Alicyclobacillus fastidiosus]|uniref:Uncharacterized protein n=1 Tax=Alicyclobacillus fastidiosus TaxID=392011 RepID=A0ABY6ZEV0_9BACL|nr:hypothetical protein [Alicyclobacillus fastidiosus]WAH41353.1 hypothetical protein NZD89_24395 [Alicyclobacillus fastidiosus]
MGKEEYIIDLLERHHLELEKLYDAIKGVQAQMSLMRKTIAELEIDKLQQMVSETVGESIWSHINDLESKVNHLSDVTEALYYKT